MKKILLLLFFSGFFLNANVSLFAQGATPLTSGTPVSGFLSSGNSGPYSYNQTQSYWSVAGVRPPTGSDFDLDLSANISFSPVLKSSGLGGSAVDYVVSDYNFAPTGLQYVRVHDFSGSGTYYLEWEDGANALAVPSNTGNLTWGTNDVVKVWDVNLTAGVPYAFKLHEPSGNFVNFGISLFKPTGVGSTSYFNRSGYAATSDSAAGLDEQFTYTPTTTGWYGFVVWSNTPAFSAVYDITVSNLLSEIPILSSVALATPASLSFYQTQFAWNVMGVRSPTTDNDNLFLYANAAHTTLLASSTIATNGTVDFVVGDNNFQASSTFYYPQITTLTATNSYRAEFDESSGFFSLGPALTVNWGSTNVVKVYDVNLTAGKTYDFDLSFVSGTTDVGIALFRPTGSAYYAGRVSADASSNSGGTGVGESFSYTAPSTGTYGFVVWGENPASSTFTISANPRLINAVMTNRGSGTGYYSINQANNYWSVAATRAASTMNIDMWLYSDVGYQNQLASSTLGTGIVDFIVTDNNHSPLGQTYLKTDDVVNPGRAGYSVQWEGGTEQLTVPGSTSGVVWNKTDIAKIFDVTLVAGVNYTFSVSLLSGVPDVGIALFQSGGAPYYAGRNSNVKVANVNGAGVGETFSYTPTGTAGSADRFGFVVWAADSSSAATLRIDVSQPLLTSAVTVTSGVSPGLYAFNQLNSKWSITGIRPAVGSDFDLQLHDTSSYTNAVATSGFGSNNVDFIAVDHNHAPAGYYFPKVNLFSGTGTYDLEWEGGSESLTVPGTTSPPAWGNTTVVRMFDAPLVAGTPYVFTLNALSGTFNTGIALFNSNGGAYYLGRGAEVKSADINGNGLGESFSFTPTVSDIYGFAVWSDNAAAGTYSITVNQPPTVISAIRDTLFNEDQGSNIIVVPNLNTVFSDPGSTMTFSTSVIGGGITSNISSNALRISTVQDSNGVYKVIVNASDGTFTTSDTFNVTLNPVNDAPYVASALRDTSFAEDFGKTFVRKLTAVFADIDNPTLTYAASNLSAGVTAQVSNDSLYVLSVLNFNGSVNIRVTATDAASATAADTFGVTVTAVNDAPVVSNAIPDTTLNEDFAGKVFRRKLSFNFSDVDNGSLTYSATSLTAGVTTVVSNDTLYLTSVLNDTSDGNVRVTASDGSLSVSDTFKVTLVNINDAPVVSSSITDRTYPENFGKIFVVKLTNVFSDIDNATLTYAKSTVSVDGDVTALISNDSLYVLSSQDSNGTDSIRVTATDGQFTVADTFKVTVTNVNNPPFVASALRDTIFNEDFGKLFVRKLTAVFGDVDSPTLSYTATTISADGDVTTLISNDTLYVFSSKDSTGADSIKVTASDGQYSVSDTFKVTVNAVNDAPYVANALRDTTFNEDFGKLFVRKLTAVFADVDGPPSTYASFILAGSVTAQISNDSLYVTSALNANGASTIRVTAFDGTSTASDTFAVTVNAINDPPVISLAISDTTVNEDFGKIFRRKLSSNFTDVDNGSLTYTATPLSAGVTANTSNDTLYITSVQDFFGIVDIKVSATDGAATVLDTFKVTVSAINDAPYIAAALPDTAVNEDFGRTFFRKLPYSYKDVDNPTLTYTATNLSAGITVSISNDSLYLNSVSNFNGAVDVKVTATDGAFTVLDTFKVTVNAVNDAPFVQTALPDTTLNEDFAGKIRFRKLSYSFKDADDPVLTYTAAALTAGITPFVSNDTLYLNSVQNFFGAVNVVITARDAQYNITDTTRITVSAVNDPPFRTNALRDTTLNEDFGKVFVAKLSNNFSDVDNGSLTYAPFILAGSVTAQISNDSLYLLSVAFYNGTANVRVTATDNLSAAIADTFNVVINNVNNAPLVSSPLRDTTFAEDSGQKLIRKLTAVFSDVDNATLSYNYFVLSSGVKVQISNDSLYVAGDENFSGTATVRITADDGQFTVADTFDIVITPVNDPPFILSALPDTTLLEDFGKIFVARLSNNFADLDNANLTFTAINLSAGVTPAVSNDSLFLTSVLNFNAQASIKVSASDGSFSVSDTFTVTIIPKPVLTIDVLANTISNRYLAIYVNSSKPLVGNIQGTFVLKDLTNTTTISTVNDVLSKIPNHAELFYTQYQLSQSGNLNISVTGMDSAGNSATNTRVYSVNALSKNTFFSFASPDHALELKGKAAGDGYLLIGVEKTDVAAELGKLKKGLSAPENSGWAPVGDVFELISTSAVRDRWTVTVKYSAEHIQTLKSQYPNFDERYIGLYQETGGQWVYAGGQGRSNGVSGEIQQLGRVRLFYNPDHVVLPESIELAQNYPNPFNPTTTIKFALPKSTRVKLVVYNILGQVVKELVNKDFQAGYHTVQWDGHNQTGNAVSSGVYLYRIETVEGAKVRKMMLIK